MFQALYNKVSVKPCKCRTCHNNESFDDTCSYIAGFPICKTCYITVYDDSLNWFQMKDIKTYFSSHLPNLYQHIFYYWSCIPLQAKLIGLLTVLAKNIHPYTLKESEPAGQRFLECAMSYPYQEFNKIAWLAGPLANRHFTNFNKNTFKHIKQLDIRQFLFLGFLQFPKKCSFINKEQVGENIKSIDNSDNDPRPYPFRMIQLTCSYKDNFFKSRFLMTAATYNVYRYFLYSPLLPNPNFVGQLLFTFLMLTLTLTVSSTCNPMFCRCLLQGQPLSIVCTSPDFKPVQEWWVDGSHPFRAKRPKEKKLLLYNADQMPWWRWDKYLAYCRKHDIVLHVYGSIEKCLSSLHGAFVHLIHTFKVLDEYGCMGYDFNVSVSSFQLEGIKERGVVEVERSFIESQPNPVFDIYETFHKHCTVHDIWKTDISFLGLMQAGHMKPKFQALPLSTINKFYYRSLSETPKASAAKREPSVSKKRRVDTTC